MFKKLFLVGVIYSHPVRSRTFGNEVKDNLDRVYLDRFYDYFDINSFKLRGLA